MGKWSASCIVRGSAAGNRRVPARISHKVIFIELQCLSTVVMASKHQEDLAAGKVFYSAALREEHFRLSQSLSLDQTTCSELYPAWDLRCQRFCTRRISSGLTGYSWYEFV